MTLRYPEYKRAETASDCVEAYLYDHDMSIREFAELCHICHLTVSSILKGNVLLPRTALRIEKGTKFAIEYEDLIDGPLPRKYEKRKSKRKQVEKKPPEEPKSSP